MGKFIDLSNKRFGRWHVTCKWEVSSSNRNTHWLCVCDCGRKRYVSGSSLRMGVSTSCGCYRGDLLPARMREFRFKHGLTHSPTYRSWSGMRSRVKPKFIGRKYYFDRGIKVCKRWKIFKNFLKEKYKIFKIRLRWECSCYTQVIKEGVRQWISRNLIN